jgi:hypothetical protein
MVLYSFKTISANRGGEQKAHGNNTVGKSVRRNTTMTHEAVLYMGFLPLADGLSEDMNRLSAMGL